MAVTWAFDDGQLPAWGQAVSIIDCADMNGAPLAVTNAHRRAGLVGPRAVTPGVAANSGPQVGRRVFYCELCSADGSSPRS